VFVRACVCGCVCENDQGKSNNNHRLKVASSAGPRALPDLCVCVSERASDAKRTKATGWARDHSRSELPELFSQRRLLLAAPSRRRGFWGRRRIKTRASLAWNQLKRINLPHHHHRGPSSST
jgi:hypothetical protein